MITSTSSYSNSILIKHHTCHLRKTNNKDEKKRKDTVSTVSRIQDKQNLNSIVGKNTEGTGDRYFYVVRNW